MTASWLVGGSLELVASRTSMRLPLPVAKRSRAVLVGHLGKAQVGEKPAGKLQVRRSESDALKAEKKSTAHSLPGKDLNSKILVRLGA